MKAMIRAAGFGTRRRPLTDRVPKPLLPIGGRSLIEWNLLLLRYHGFTDVVINLHHLADQIEDTIADGTHLGMRVTYSREAVILGTGGGIKCAEPFFANEGCLALNGDTLLDLDLRELVETHRQRGDVATMVVREDPEAERWGAVEIDEEQRVIRITGQGLPDHEATEKVMFAGVHVMQPKLLAYIPAGQPSSIIDAYARAINAGDRIMGYRMHGYWSDVGTPARYEQVQRDVAGGLLRLENRLLPVR